DVGPAWVGNPPGLFPIQSADTLITGAVMGVEGLNLVPGGCARLVAAGSTNLPLLMIHFSIAGGQVTVTSLRVDRSGSANSDTDIAAVKAWNDTNGNRRFEPALDTLLGTGTFVGGTATIGLSPNVSVTAGAPRDLFISFDISSTASAGESAGVGMADETYIGTVPPLSADPNAFPINSGTYFVVGAPPSCLTVSHVDLAASVPLLQIARNQTDVPMLLVNLSASGNLTTAKAILVLRRGTSTDVDVARARVWHDLNKNGKLDRQTDIPLGTATFVSGVATTSLGQGVAVAAGTTESLIVALDIAANAVAGHTVGVEMDNQPQNSLTVDPPPPATLIAYAGGAPQSTDLTIVDKPAPALSVYATDIAASVPNLQVFRNQTNVGMLALRLTTTAPTNVTGIRVDGRGTAGANIGQDVSAVSVWLDDLDGKFDPAKDLKQASGSFVSGVVTLGFTANFGTGQTRTLFVAFDIASTATTGNQVGAELDDARYFGVDFGTTVVLDPASPLDFPIRSTQLTIAAGTPPPPKGTVNVLVKDKASQAGIAGASVNVSGAGYGRTLVADASGNASFADVPLGGYTVKVSHVDYDAATDQTATLSAASRTANVTFELTKKTVTPPGPGGSNTLLILLIALLILGALVALLLMKRKKCPECSATWRMGQEQCWKCGHKPTGTKDVTKKEEKPAEPKKEGGAAAMAKEDAPVVEKEEPSKPEAKRPPKKDDMVPPAPLD
ncbi:MAG TPA: carboxypeptidase-like regulatory domain-containing protein, partial [Thermoplasmata archaeon]|nr:carboxypeptidase-like regulatory domain-containing protein [Thermoplasmata archaeon]